MRRDHWLRLNEAHRVPRRLLSVDATSQTTLQRRATRHTFRTAAGALDLLGGAGRPEAAPHRVGFDQAADLWEWVAESTATTHRTVLFAYDLSQLWRLTGALEALPALGFKPTRTVLNDYSCWGRFVKGKRTLMLCDVRSWLPAPLGRIAGDLNLAAPRPPAVDAGVDAWERYTRRRAEIVRLACLNLLEWLHDDDLGDFRPTGHAQASAAFRHRFLAPRTVLVHWGGETRDAERRAAWTGRAEVWRPGKVQGPLVEYDYTAAYAWIAERESLPTRLLGPVVLRDRATLIAASPSRSVLYEADVTTEAPTLPTLYDDRIVWPVGSFTTTVWDVELENAIREGATVKLRRAWLYERAPVLRPWARWVLACLAGEVDSIDPLRRRVVKAWSRSLIGRFALRYPELRPIRVEDDAAVKITTIRDAAAGRDVREIQVGFEVFEQAGVVDGADSTPQIMSAVMSHARVRLWRTMRAAGFENVLYVDTDSVLVTPAGAGRIEAELRQGHFPGLRQKATYSRGDLRAPRNIDLDDERRVAGLPKTAGLRADGVFEAEVWESLTGSLRRRRPAGVFRLQRSFTLGNHDYRREQLDAGGSQPFRLIDGVRVS